MIYSIDKKFTDVDLEHLQNAGVKDEEVKKQLIRDMIKEIPIEELEKVFQISSEELPFGKRVIVKLNTGE